MSNSVFSPRVALRAVTAAVCLVVTGGAAAQLVFGGSGGDKPFIVCRAWVGASNTLYASETVANNPQATERFRYHAEKWGGDDTHIDCQEYRAMTPEFDRTWRPGNSYQNYREETMTVERADFLPDGWDTTPTPAEKDKQKLAKTKAKASTGSSTTAGADEPPRKSPADIAAEEAATRRAKYEAEFQAKQAAYERDLAEQKRQVDEFERAEAEVARQKAEQQAKADAVMEAFRRQSEAHAAVMRKYQEDTASYQSKLGQPAGSAGATVEDLGMRKFQATGMIRKTRDQAMASLMAHPHSATLTDVQCDQIKGFENEWTCWGFYLQKVTRSGVSKQ